MLRRDFLRRSATTMAGAAAVNASPAAAAAVKDRAEPGNSPYGPLQEADENGVRLPKGFSSRIVARANQPVGDTGYLWHPFPDGGFVFKADDGWIYASNSEVPAPPGAGGVGAIRFDADGKIVDAYPILRGTTMNCAGGPTPWGTWLSCEEHEAGQVWECDPTGPSQGVARPALGTFSHEAATVDPRRAERRIYLTEDVGDGGFYRFTPANYPDLSEGVLEIAVVEGFEGESATGGGRVRWEEVPNPNPVVAPEAGAPQTPTRAQVPEATKFNGGEGIAFDGKAVFFATKGDNRIWRYVPTTRVIDVVYFADDFGDNAPLTGVDNIGLGPSDDLYIAEDGGNMQIVLITPDGIVAPFMQLVDIPDTAQEGSEVAGPAFSPDGTRLYFSSQRAGPTPSSIGSGFGVTYEVTGPFRGARGPGDTGTGGEPGGDGETGADTGDRASASDSLAEMSRRALPATGGGGLLTVAGGLAVAGAVGLRNRLRR